MNLSTIFQFHYTRTRITVTLHEDQYTFLIISRSVLFRIKNVSDKSNTETRIALFLFSIFFNRAFYEIMWKNIVERSRPQMTIWRMHISCWVPKATNTHSGCVILIVFSLQHWLQALASVFRYTYIVCLVAICSKSIYLLLNPWSRVRLEKIAVPHFMEPDGQ